MTDRPAAPRTGSEVAVIGMACRVPGARSLDAFWANLRDGVESVSRFSDAELRAAGVAPELMADPRYVKSRAVVADIESFDASFFGFSAREAELADPQHRLLLEAAWEALEHAGCRPGARASVGVFAGIGLNAYLLRHIYPNRDRLGAVDQFQVFLGNDRDFASTRLSYKLNLTGPSLDVQTACSTSLVAVHLACASLLNGDCDLALAGGASIHLPQVDGYMHQEGMIFSSDGHCRAFDARADGTVGGSGAGIVVLKRLDAARADADVIHAVILGSAINNDGAAKIGYTAPSIEGQAAVIREAHAVAGVDPVDVSYIEAHGTGTSLGDPIEVAALAAAFGTSPPGQCGLGSVKTNIGHLDAAAGVIGLIKTILALEHRTLPPSLHFERPNPQIDFARTPFYVVRERRPWDTPPGSARIAGVSSFGIGGTNAHAVVEEAPPPAPSGPSRQSHLLVLSAKTPTALAEMSRNLSAYLGSNTCTLADVSYSLATGRHAFEYRRAVAAPTREEAIRSLAAPDAVGASRHGGPSGQRPLLYACGGDATSCQGLVRELPELDLAAASHADHEVMAAVERAMERLWRSWGVPADALALRAAGTPGATVLATAADVMELLGRLWVEGVDVDWRAFFAHEQRRRVPLPGYPFERQRYWIDLAPPREAADPARADSLADLAAIRLTDPADWCSVPVWTQSWPGRPSDRRGERWLVFEDELGVAPAVAAHLQARGHAVTRVRAGRAFHRIAGDVYVIDPRDRRHADELMRDLSAAGRLPRRLLHAWALRPDAGATTVESVDPALDLGFYSLLHLIQAIGEQGLGVSQQSAIEIAVVAAAAHDIVGGERLSIDAAAVLGPSAVAPLEYPGMVCRVIDVEVPVTPAERDLLASCLDRELAVEAEEDLVAFRRGRRWVRRFERLRLDRPASGAALRAGGTVLVTGGLGGVGLEIADHFARTPGARIALVGRSAPTPHARERLRAMEEQGAQVAVWNADVTDEAAMRRVLADVRARFGAVHGVVHAAGVPPGGLIARETSEGAARVLAPKLIGARVLESLFAGEPLDFFVLCSSLRTVVPAPGGAAYAAANACLGAFARRHHAEWGAVAVDWDGWREVGMGVTTGVLAGLSPAELEEAGMASRDALDILDRLRGAPWPEVVVSMHDLDALRRRPRTLFDAAAIDRPNVARHPRPALPTAFAPPASEVERALAGIWEDVLGVGPLGVDDNFLELGGDSILSLQVSARASAIGLRLSPRHVFEHQTIAAQAAAGETAGAPAEQGLVTGMVPLTPIQHAFVSQHPADPDHFNQHVMLELAAEVGAGEIAHAAAALAGHHDALRLRLRRDGPGWRQWIEGAPEVPVVSDIDVSADDPAIQASRIDEAAAALHASLSLADGPIFRIALFHCGARAPRRLLFVVHHLAIDAVSWRILLEDLFVALGQARRGDPIHWPPKTTSFKRWADVLVAYASSDDARRELSFWQAAVPATAAPLPADRDGGSNVEAEAETMTVALEESETEAFEAGVARTFGARADEVLLAALAGAFHEWTRGPLLVDVEAMGRQPPAAIGDVDLSRTVGWCTAVFPVCLDGAAAQAGDRLRRVTEVLRRVPAGGLGYGVLRYLCPDDEVRQRLASQPRADVSFVYLGRIDGGPGGAADGVQLIRDAGGPPRAPRGRRRYAIDVEARLSDGRLRTTWTWSRALHRTATIERLADAFMRSLRDLMAERDEQLNRLLAEIDEANAEG